MIKNNELNSINLKSDSSYFIPLGGCSEFGNNVNVLAYQDQYLVMDFGASFAEDHHPGVDILLPNISFLTEKKDKVKGIVITHGHLDHIGALAHLWPQLECPIYAPAFTADIIRNILSEVKFDKQPKIIELSAKKAIQIGAFEVVGIMTAHSVPNSMMLKITMGDQVILNTGDWKIDNTPLVGAYTDIEALKDIGNAGGVDALFIDSTNVVKQGVCPSFNIFEKSFKVLLEQEKQAIFVVCQGVASFTRLRALIDLAPQYGRNISLVGRSILSAYPFALKHQIIPENDIIIPYKDLLRLPAEKRIFVCTGSQAEPRAAMTRISVNDHPDILIQKGDAAVFSARIIPGREIAIASMKQALSRRGVSIITNHEIPNIYVSGHAYADEAKSLIDWVKPKAVLPIHGDYDHQEEMAQVVHTLQKNISCYVPENGDIIEISNNLNVIGRLETGTLAIDGDRLIDAENSKSLAERRKMAFNGVVSVSVMIDDEGYLLQEPDISVLGLCETQEDEEVFQRDLQDQIERYLTNMDDYKRSNKKLVHEEVRLAARRYVRYDLGKKPVLIIHVVQL